MTYLPATNHLGPDKFTFKVSDSFAETEPATFTIQVVRRNRPPESKDQSVSISTGELAAIALNVSDPDDDLIRTVILKGPRYGLIFGSGTNFNYTPKAGALGTDSFTYKAWDGQKFGNIARVTLVVSPPRSQLPPSFRSIRNLGEVVELVLETPNTTPFFIDTSTNLVDWSVTAGPFVAAAEHLTYQDTNATLATRFYRARRQN
jgi:hypothetical protein